MFVVVGPRLPEVGVRLDSSEYVVMFKQIFRLIRWSGGREELCRDCCLLQLHGFESARSAHLKCLVGKTMR